MTSCLSPPLLGLSPGCGTTPAPSWLWPWTPSLCHTGWGTTASPCGRWLMHSWCLGERWLGACNGSTETTALPCNHVWSENNDRDASHFRLWLLMVASPFPWCMAALCPTPSVPVQMRFRGNPCRLVQNWEMADATASWWLLRALKARGWSGQATCPLFSNACCIYPWNWSDNMKSCWNWSLKFSDFSHF